MSFSPEENQEINNQNTSEINSQFQEEPKNNQEQRSIIDPSTELGSKYIYLIK